jgi:hypothetical protein
MFVISKESVNRPNSCSTFNSCSPCHILICNLQISTDFLQIYCNMLLCDYVDFIPSPPPGPLLSAEHAALHPCQTDTYHQQLQFNIIESNREALGATTGKSNRKSMSGAWVCRCLATGEEPQSKLNFIFPRIIPGWSLLQAQIDFNLVA